MSSELLKTLADPSLFRLWTPIQTRYSDIDSMGHVNHAVIVTYFESGRGTVMDQVPRPATSGFVLGEVAVRYLGEVRVDDRLRIGSKITQVGKSSFDMGQALMSTPAGAEGGEGTEICVATCTSTLVHIGMEQRRAAPLPEDARRVLEDLI